MMNEAQFNGMWNNVKGEVKKQWGQLTDNDLRKVEGNKDKLLAMIEEKYGLAKEKAQDELDKFLDKMNAVSAHNYSMGDAIRTAGEGVKDFSYRIADKSEQLSDKAHDKFDENYEQVLSFVKNNPLKSALIGIGVGLLMGKLLK